MKKLLNKYFILIMILWFVPVLAYISFMGAWHKADYSQTERKKNVGHAQNWQMIHFLAGACECSEFIVEYLEKRGKSESNIEKVVIIDDVKNFKHRLTSIGYNVELLTMAQYDELDISGVPLLVIAAPNGKVHYQGGYSDGLINPLTIFNDLKIVENLKQDRIVASLPAYGCSVSQKFQKWIDPLNFKYGDK